MTWSTSEAAVCCSRAFPQFTAKPSDFALLTSRVRSEAPVREGWRRFVRGHELSLSIHRSKCGIADG